MKILSSNKFFTLIELLIIVAIIGILLSLLLPSLSKAREKAFTAVCGSNMKQLSDANQVFLKENNFKFPQFFGSVTVWAGKTGERGIYKNWNVKKRVLNVYLGITDSDDLDTEMPVMRCPSSDGHYYNYEGSDYVHNSAYYKDGSCINISETSCKFLSQVKQPSKFILAEENPGFDWTIGWASGRRAITHGQNRYNMAAVDGSVKFRMQKYKRRITTDLYTFDNRD
jgi:hypothetical protein